MQACPASQVWGHLDLKACMDTTLNYHYPTPALPSDAAPCTHCTVLCFISTGWDTVLHLSLLLAAPTVLTAAAACIAFGIIEGNGAAGTALGPHRLALVLAPLLYTLSCAASAEGHQQRSSVFNIVELSLQAAGLATMQVRATLRGAASVFFSAV